MGHLMSGTTHRTGILNSAEEPADGFEAERSTIIPSSQTTPS